MQDAGDSRRATFREVLAIREFRALYLAQTLSVVGDQLARIAVGVMVFDRTGSSTLTGVSYAVSYLPWLVGGPTLSVLADRYPRRTVMIACDSARTLLVGLLAIPSCPTAALIGVVALTAMLQPPFTAARAATIPDIVGDGDSYAAAATLSNTTLQLAVLAGFGAGGALTAALGSTAAILVDSLTFAVSTLAISRSIERRPPVSTHVTSWREVMGAGWQIVFGDNQLRWLVTTSWILVGTVVTTEAIAVPYARAHGDGAGVAGLLSASMPLGTAFGALLLGRRVDTERAILPTLALLTPLVLSITAANPRPLVAVTVWFCAGALGSVTVLANRIFVVAVPREIRGRAFGVAAAGIAGAQGVGTLGVGLISGRTNPAASVAIACATSFVMLSIPNAKRLGAVRRKAPPSSPESHANFASYSQL